MKKNIFICLLCFTMLVSVFAQVSISTEPHLGDINTIAKTTDGFFTVGSDGFVIKWNEEDFTGEHFQASDLEIQTIAIQPNSDNIAIYETDGFSVYRVSVWNWKTKQRLFAKRFSDSVLSISYSEKGTYLMVGTASFEGIVFLDSKTGTALSILQNQYGSVVLSKTGKSENSSVMYASSGNLIYINLTDGSEKAKFSCQSNLTDTLLFDKNKYLVGYFDGNIYVIQATSGKTLQVIPSINPIFLISEDDSSIAYLENTDTSNSIYQIKFIDVANPKDSTITFELQTSNKITSGIITNTNFYFSDTDGEIYITSDFDNRFSSSISLTSITQRTTSMIYDIAYFNQEYYLLTEDSLLKISGPNEDIIEIISEIENTNLFVYKDSILLWSKNKSQSVNILSFDNENVSIEPLFEPNGSITSMNCDNDTLVYITGNSKVYAYSFLTKETKLLYTGSGLQDVLLQDNNIYVAKTSATNPKSAMISINLNTQETVQLSVSGDIIFSLTFDNTQDTSNIYGISVSTIDKRKTELFKYSTKLKQYTPLMQWADEDTEAFTFINSDSIFTNIGKTNLRIYNIKTKKVSQIKRSASLPKKVSGTSKKMAILNKDGSLTWYIQTGSSSKISTSYLSKDNHWLAF